MGSKIQMLTGRTAKYVEAMIREGDDFDYSRWLRGVQQEEARLKSVAVSSSVQPIVAEPSHPARNAQNPGEFEDLETIDKEKTGQIERWMRPTAANRTKSIDKP